LERKKFRRDLEKLKDYADRHNIEKTFTNAEALINDPNIDAVYIATPPNTHKYYALKVAEAGKPCCIEKPLSPSYSESLEIQTAFEQKSIPLFVAYYRRSLPRFLKIKEWLDKNYIGNVRHITSHLSKPASLIDISKASTASWIHENGITGSGTWNFGGFDHLDQVTIYGSKGTIEFSVFHENPIQLKSETKNEAIVKAI